MPKMPKTGFRGERKRKGAMPQAIGTRRECDEKSKETSPLPPQRGGM